MYENAEIHCQKGHTAMQYVTTPLSFQYFCPRTIDLHAYMDFYSSSSLKQTSAGKHVASLGHIILFSRKQVFASP